MEDFELSRESLEDLVEIICGETVAYNSWSSIIHSNRILPISVRKQNELSSELNGRYRSRTEIIRGTLLTWKEENGSRATFNVICSQFRGEKYVSTADKFENARERIKHLSNSNSSAYDYERANAGNRPVQVPVQPAIVDPKLEDTHLITLANKLGANYFKAMQIEEFYVKSGLYHQYEINAQNKSPMVAYYNAIRIWKNNDSENATLNKFLDKLKEIDYKIEYP